MFKELGYEVEFNHNKCMSYIRNNKQIIRFLKGIKVIEMINKDEYEFAYELDLLKAINKQVEELGWNE